MHNVATCNSTVFYWGKWLSEKDKPHLTSTELYPLSAAPSKTCQYTITTYTSDLPGASTNAKVSARILGTDGRTPLFDLKSHEDSFQRASRDDFIVKGTDVGTVQELYIGHNNA